MQYSVEQLNSDGEWQAVQQFDSIFMSGSMLVPGGRLYRTKGCNGRSPSFDADCVLSTVVWAPIYPGENEIPAEVAAPDGQIMLVSDNVDLASQTVQYNLYLLIQTLTNEVDLKTLPAMTEVRESDLFVDGRLTLEERIKRVVYNNYSQMQLAARDSETE